MTDTAVLHLLLLSVVVIFPSPFWMDANASEILAVLLTGAGGPLLAQGGKLTFWPVSSLLYGPD